eukprot:SAG31_NODE_4916_length_2869_cov_3.648375_4_plen_436_part_00
MDQLDEGGDDVVMQAVLLGDAVLLWTVLQRVSLEPGTAAAIDRPRPDAAEANNMLSAMSRITPFWLACFLGKLEIVRMLLERRHSAGICQIVIDVNHKASRSTTGRTVAGDVTPFWAAAWAGQADVCRLLMMEPDVDTHHPTADGRTPLMIACWGGHLDVVQLLLSRQPIKELPEMLAQTDTAGRTAFAAACCAGRLPVVRYLAETNSMALITAVPTAAISTAQRLGDNTMLAYLDGLQALHLLHACQRLAFAKSLNVRLAHGSPVDVLPRRADLGGDLHEAVIEFAKTGPAAHEGGDCDTSRSSKRPLHAHIFSQLDALAEFDSINPPTANFLVRNQLGVPASYFFTPPAHRLALCIANTFDSSVASTSEQLCFSLSATPTNCKRDSQTRRTQPRRDCKRRAAIAQASSEKRMRSKSASSVQNACFERSGRKHL